MVANQPTNIDTKGKNERTNNNEATTTKHLQTKSM